MPLHTSVLLGQHLLLTCDATLNQLPNLEREFTEVHFHIDRPPFPFASDYIRNTRAWRLWIDQRTLPFTGDSGSVRWECVSLHTLPPCLSKVAWELARRLCHFRKEGMGEAAPADLSLWPYVTFNPSTGWLTLDSPVLSDQLGCCWLLYCVCVFTFHV